MEGKIEVGDVVYLKSNPKHLMTVSEINNDGVCCLWQDAINKKQRDFYPDTVLEKYVKSSPMAGNRESKNSY